ncbi:MAG: ribose-phosphate diphosphokinase [Methanobacteriaceae archaeon]|nr:ribose-phosphate diphosphokinase [Methanobacteriaceae archaeon]
MVVIGGSASQKLAAEIATYLDDKLALIETKKFPDGERYIRINEKINSDEQVIVVQSTGYPQDENILELLFILDTLEDMNIKEIILISPYLGYSRQERRFKDTECISAKTISKLIESRNIKSLITVNLHEDSIRNFYEKPVYNLSAMPAIVKYLKTHQSNIIKNKPVILAPDKGALNFAKDIAIDLDTEYDYLEKVRLSPEKVETKTKNIDVTNKDVIIIDDIISTGGTIVNAIKILHKQKAKDITVICVHPVFVNDAILKIYAAGAKDIISTNTLKSDVSSISLAELIAEKIKLIIN